MDFLSRIISLNADFNSRGQWFMMEDIDGHVVDDVYSNDPFQVGAKCNFVPVLCEIPPPLAKGIPLSAYICQIDNGHRIGYVRIPHYRRNEVAAREFEELIIPFEAETDALVLDQVCNTGGSMFQTYAITSALTSRALNVPRHQIMIDDDTLSIIANTIERTGAGRAIPLSQWKHQLRAEHDVQRNLAKLEPHTLT